MRVITYARVSTVRQKVLGASLDAQQAAVAAECERRGWTLSGLETEAQSAKDMRHRPALNRALSRLDEGAYDVLMVARMDRAFRSVGDFASVLDRSRRRGWQLVMLDPAVDTTDPHGEAMAYVAAAFAQLERRLISQRTREAIEARKQAGTYRGGHLLPQSMPVGGEAVEAIMRHADDASSREIAAMLDMMGLAAPRGDAWSDRTVRAVIARERAKA